MTVEVPWYSPVGNSIAVAWGRSSHKLATTPFATTGPQLLLTPYQGPITSTLTVKGTGFGAGETVQIGRICDPGESSQCGDGNYVLLGTAVAGTGGTGSAGEFTSTISLTTPASMTISPGTNIIFAWGSSSKSFAVNLFIVTPLS